MSNYPNPNVLVDVDELKRHLGDSHYRILDVRASDARLPIGYRMGHIPGALELDPTREFFVLGNGSAHLKSPEGLAQALASHGISNDTSLLIYDEWTGQLAAMTYWVLCYLGHREVQVLHGGWARWRSEGGPISREAPPFFTVAYHPAVNEQTRATAEWIQANSSRPDLVLLDVRTPDEYVMGHIPGALSWSYDSALDLRTQMFKDPGELQARLQAAGVTPDREIVAYCASGSRSSHMFTTLQLLGYPRIRNYEGSMADWYHGRRLPVEPGGI